MLFHGFQKYGKWPERDQGGGRERDVHNLNRIADFDPVKPNYPQDLSARRVIEFVYLPQAEVLILASMDGQYPFWVSRTAIGDIETNTAIANGVLFEDFSTFTMLYPKLNALIEYRYRRRFNLADGKINTPFDYGFSSEPDQIKYWGRYMAQGIASHYRHIKELCTYRELDGQYLGFLEAYLAQLKTQTGDAVADYDGKRVLIKLITGEDYLYVSDNEAIRGTYVKMQQEISELYNAYMSIVR